MRVACLLSVGIQLMFLCAAHAQAADLRLHPLQPGSYSESLFFATTRIEVFGTKEKRIGTGFFFQADATKTFIITDKQLVGPDNHVECLVSEGDQQGHALVGYKRIRWNPTADPPIYHPDSRVSLIALPFTAWGIVNESNPSNLAFWRAIEASAVLSNEQLFVDMRGVERVLMYGYPRGLAMDTLPIVREGITALPAWIDYSSLGFSQSRDGTGLGLAEITCSPASLGSPVVYIDLPLGAGLTTINRNGHARTPRYYLLGIMSKAVHLVDGLPRIQHISATQNGSDANLGLYWKAHKLIEMLQRRICPNGECSLM